MVNSTFSNTTIVALMSWTPCMHYLYKPNEMFSFSFWFIAVLSNFFHIMVNIHLIDLRSTLAHKCFFVSLYLYHTARLYHLKVWNNSIEEYTFILVYWLCTFYSVNIAGCCTLLVCFLLNKLSWTSRPSQVGSVFLQQTHKHI